MAHDDPSWLADRLEEDREYDGAAMIRAQAARIAALEAVVANVRKALADTGDEAASLRQQAQAKGGDRTRDGRWMLGRMHGIETARRAVSARLPIEWAADD